MVASDPQGSSADVTDEVEEDAATIGDLPANLPEWRALSSALWCHSRRTRGRLAGTIPIGCLDGHA
jgi:hypothetical protein